MDEPNLLKINVNAIFANFKTAKYQRKITPLEFYTPDGHTHPIEAIRRTYVEQLPQSTRIHFILRTLAGRYFDIIYDPTKMSWYMVKELKDTFDVS